MHQMILSAASRMQNADITQGRLTWSSSGFLPRDLASSMPFSTVGQEVWLGRTAGRPSA